jgi:UDP-N-acetylmuramate--alanine ligase
MSFHPRRIVLTAVESDHQDFFPDYNSIRDAFVEYCRLLPAGGQLIYCTDDPGAAEVAGILKKENPSLEFIPYGFNAQGAYRIENYRVENEKAFFSLAAFPDLSMRVPGRHQACNAAAALALCSSLLRASDEGWNEQRLAGVKKALLEFRSSKRRSEILGEERGILFMDDYGHHPTAIRSTLEGLKAFYPRRRIVLSFMSHTYTRTSALMDEFAGCFDRADILFLHKIYSSAREQYRGGINGKTLYEKINARAGTAAIPLRSSIKSNSGNSQTLYYIDEPTDSFEQAKEILREGDLFITMGAGNNWPLGLALYNYFKGKKDD